jgi:hypothetical protein
MRPRTPEEDRQRMRARRERLRAEGRCYRCENLLDCDSVQHCARCLKAAREYRREYGGHREPASKAKRESQS